MSLLSKPKLILGSASPRRRELLQQLGYPFMVHAPQVEELRRTTESVVDYMQRNVREKAASVAATLATDSLILAADTAVIWQNHLFEKPSGPEQARAMLLSLSGQWHEVVTVFILLQGSPERGPSETYLASVKTRVQFAEIPATELQPYLATKEPYDKAGGYAIQGHAARWVRRIEGSYTNVVGLPLCEVREALQAFWL